MEFNKEVGMRIKTARTNQKISLKELGEKVGLSEGTMQRYETGQIKGVDVNLLKSIASALECTEAYLMGWEEEYIPPTTISAHATADLTPEEQDKVMEYIKFLKMQRGL